MGAETLTTVGALLADTTRATVLVALLDGRARTAGELARHAGVAPSTMSQHLTRLVGGGFVEVVSQGRHRYFRIASDEIGLLLEKVGGLDLVDSGRPVPFARAPEALRFARSCYDHLAGELAVRLHDQLLAGGRLHRADGNLALTDSGHAWFAELGVEEWGAPSDRPPVRACLDWTERRDHLAGPASAALFTTLLARSWLVRGSRPRAIRLTERGRAGLRAFVDF